MATMPSGGKGEVTAAAGPLEVTGTLRAPWLIQIWEDMQNERKGEEEEGEEGASPSEVPLFRAVCCSCLLAVFGCRRWSWQGACLEQCAYLCYLQPWQLCSAWKASRSLGRAAARQRQEKVLPGGESPAEGALSWGERRPPREEAPTGTAWQIDSDSEQLGFRGEWGVSTIGEPSLSTMNSEGDNGNVY